MSQAEYDQLTSLHSFALTQHRIMTSNHTETTSHIASLAISVGANAICDIADELAKIIEHAKIDK